jgi:hypothetical protein
MKTLWRIAGAVVILLVVALLVLRATGLDPKDRRPGLWLKGNVVTTPVNDWSFSDKYPTIMIQTGTPYLLPHSVTINCVSVNGDLYLHSTFRAGIPFPDGKGWTAALARDPRVRVKIGDQLYDRTVTVVTDQAELDALNQAAQIKFPQTQNAPGAIVYYYRIPHD